MKTEGSICQPISPSESRILYYSMEFTQEISDTCELKSLAHAFVIIFI